MYISDKQGHSQKASTFSCNYRAVSYRQASSSNMQNLESVYMYSQDNTSAFSPAIHPFKPWSVFFYAPSHQYSLHVFAVQEMAAQVSLTK